MPQRSQENGSDDAKGAYSTVFLLMNICRALNSRSGIVLHIDGVCMSDQLDMSSCVMGLNELGNTCRVWLVTEGAADDATECRDAFISGLKGVIVLK